MDEVKFKAYNGDRISIFQQFCGGILSTDGDEIYYFGIIDLLQQWNAKKQFENFFKGFTHDKTKISAVSPDFYATRFLKFVEVALE